MPSRTTTSKVKQTQKFVHSNPVPLNEDSDSDFNPGSFTYEPPKRGKAKGRPTSGRSASRKKRTEILAETEDDEPEKIRLNRTPANQTSNLLVECFKDMGLQSASEDEDDENAPPAAEELSDDKEIEEHDSPEVSRTLAALKRPSPSSRLAQESAECDAPLNGSATDSETEPETDPESIASVAATTNPCLTKRKTEHDPAAQERSAKRPRFEVEDDSQTEPESDEDSRVVQSRQVSRPASPNPEHRLVTRSRGIGSSLDSGSETESDAEAEELSDQVLQPRPTFVLGPTQKALGSFVLDALHQVPWRINTFLRDYQRDGIRFFWEQYKEDMGGVLGDDMGLVSKTIQVISFLSAIMKKYGDKRDIDRRRQHVSQLQDMSKDWKERRVLPPANATWPTCLIIAPSSVVGNWEREFETWGYFEVGMYTGGKIERSEVLREFKLGRLDVLVTSFETARNDIAMLDDLAWSCVIVDEVHRLKNPRSGTAVAYDRFTCPVRFGLTGTAIQNTYSELWTILNWANPGKVGTKRQWEGYVSKPLGVGQSKSATEEQRSRAILVAQILTDKLLPHFFIRRTKEVIRKQLPKKLDEVAFCPLTSKQVEVYKRILNTDAVQNMVRKDEPCDCGSRKKRRGCHYPFEKGDLFRYLTVLIRISNHLGLILPSPTDTAEQTARNRELSKIAFPEGSVPKYGPAMLVPDFCGKWLVLESLLQNWRHDPTNKVLIFTKSVKLLHMLEYHLQSQGLGFVKLEGLTRPQDRMPLIDKFHEDPDIFVFLISTLAGGTGLNLTGANKVVIFDPNWNPAHDLQAIDRAYRFGQTRDVEVFRLLGAGSIEELIYARQVYKQQQMQVGYNASFQTRYFEGVQGEKDKQGELFGLKNIFALHESTLATKTAIERAVISDFNWALANVDAKKRRASADADVQTDRPQLKEDGQDMRGLDALLFDDRPVQVEEKDNTITRILSNVGVVYTHRNEDLIAESAIEGQRHKNAVEEKKKLKKARAQAKNDNVNTATPEVWPPVRSHHRKKMTPEERMRARQTSMIELGHIQSAEQLTSFLMQFNKWSVERQNEFLAELDRHHAKAGRKL